MSAYCCVKLDLFININSACVCLLSFSHSDKCKPTYEKETHGS